MDFRAWAEQQVCYSRARRGRFERGAQIGECGLVQAIALAKIRRQAQEELLASASDPGSAALPASSIVAA